MTSILLISPVFLYLRPDAHFVTLVFLLFLYWFRIVVFDPRVGSV